MANLTNEELLDEVNKRVQSSADTALKRQLAMIVERRSLPAKRRGFNPVSIAMERWEKFLLIWPRKAPPCAAC